jgi:hypothetical protein
MRTNPLWLLALFPWVPAPPAHAPVNPDTPLRCAISIEVRVRAPLAMGTVELSVISGDVERTRAPYAVTFCLGSSQNGCEGLEVRIRVRTIEDTSLREARAARTLSWISN